MAVSGKRKRLGEILIDAGILTEDQLNVGLLRQKETREPIGEILVTLGFVNEAQIKHALELQYGVKAFSLSTKVPPEVLRLVPEAMARQHQLMPVAINSLTVAMVDPGNILALDDIRLRFRGISIQPVVVTEADFRELLRTVPRERAAAEPAHEEELPAAVAVVPEEANADQLVGAILSAALHKRASEVLIEPHEHEAKVRFRVDGLLRAEPAIPQRMAAAVVTRLKVLAHLGAAQVQAPQVGSFTHRLEGRQLRVQLHTLPVRSGTHVSLELQDGGSLPDLTPQALIQHPRALEAFKRILEAPDGLVLVGGPRHSGKRGLLLAALSTLIASGRSAMSPEDLFLADLPDVSQVPTPEGAAGYRAAVEGALQQGPDVLAVRDLDDAEVARSLLRGANVGKLVLATVPTRQALLDEARDGWHLPERSLVAALAGLVTCRQLRRLCGHCRAPGPDGAHRAVGCQACDQTGYSGQVGAYEIYPVGPRLRPLLATGDLAAVDAQARAEGWVPLADYAAWLVQQGHTSPEEVARLLS